MIKYILISLTLAFLLLPLPSYAKKKSDSYTNPRVQNLSGEDLEMFNALSSKQQKNLKSGKIETGYNAWMVIKALGNPFYKSEHHPVYTDYEEVWLYTKNEVDKTVKEEKIVDPVNNWPSIHKFHRIKTCTKGDFFVLYDRGVVKKIVNDKSEKIYGSCEIRTQEEFIPIIDKK